METQDKENKKSYDVSFLPENIVKQKLNNIIYEYLRSNNYSKTADAFMKFLVDSEIPKVESTENSESSEDTLYTWYSHFIDIASTRGGNYNFPFIADRVECIQLLLKKKNKILYEESKTIKIYFSYKLPISGVREVKLLDDIAVLLTETSIAIVDMTTGIVSHTANIKQNGSSMDVNRFNDMIIITFIVDTNTVCTYIFRNNELVFLHELYSVYEVRRIALSNGRQLILSVNNLASFYNQQQTLITDSLLDASTTTIIDIDTLGDTIVINEFESKSVLQISSSNYKIISSYSYTESPRIVCKKNKIFLQNSKITVFVENLTRKKYVSDASIPNAIDFDFYQNDLAYLTNTAVYFKSHFVDVPNGVALYTSQFQQQSGILVFTSDGKIVLLNE